MESGIIPRFIFLFTILLLLKNAVADTPVYEVNPQKEVIIDFRKPSEIFNTFVEEEASGKFSISISLKSFVCPLVDGMDDPPYLGIEESTIGTMIQYWNCSNINNTVNWEVLASFGGPVWIKVSASPNWRVDWSAHIIAVLYQNKYASNGDCAEGYFNCNGLSDKCPNSATTARCIHKDKLVCDGIPSCGMLCNVDETDCDKQNGNEGDDSGTSIWIYIGPAVGVVGIIFVILGIRYCHQKNRGGFNHTPSGDNGGNITTLSVTQQQHATAPSAPPPSYGEIHNVEYHQPRQSRNPS